MLAWIVIVSEVYAWSAIEKGCMHALLSHFDFRDDPGWCSMGLKRPVPVTPGTARACYSPLEGIRSTPPQHVEALFVRARLPQAQPHASSAGVRGSAWGMVALIALRWRQGTLCNTAPHNCLPSRIWR
jgi:hypothetical protein